MKIIVIYIMQLMFLGTMDQDDNHFHYEKMDTQLATDISNTQHS